MSVGIDSVCEGLCVSEDVIITKTELNVQNTD